MTARFTFAVLSIAAYTVIYFSLLEIVASSHITSYVKQKKPPKAIYDEFPKSDFESVTGNSSDGKKIPNEVVPPQSLFASLMQPQLDTNLDSNNDIQENGFIRAEYNHSMNKQKTDDGANSNQNTLYNSNEIFGHNEHHESPMNTMTVMTNDSSGMWNRVKQSIPVLEPVKHLLNTVRDGSFNHTTHNKHHQLVANSGADHMNDSSAIETEEEREMVNDSTSFKLLELLGTIGGMIWGFFSNIQKIFAASSSG